jgi:acetyl esterase/lipase
MSYLPRLFRLALAGCYLPLSALAAYPPVPAGASFDAVQALPSREPTAVIRYGEAAPQFVELWLPATAGPSPVVVFVHGGCWLNQYGVDHGRALATALADAGYGVWNIEYRRVGDLGGGWPGSFEDVRAAIEALGEGKYPSLDLTRVALMGHSAGGHLALLMAGAAVADPLPGLGLRGVLALAPIVDIAEYTKGVGSCNKAAVEFMGGAPETHEAEYLAASPAHTGTLPGTVILLGSEDRIIPYRVPALGDHTLVGMPAGHFDWIHPGTPAWERLRRELEELLR